MEGRRHRKQGVEWTPTVGFGGIDPKGEQRQRLGEDHEPKRANEKHSPPRKPGVQSAKEKEESGKKPLLR
jgi:hypothetical protein